MCCFSLCRGTVDQSRLYVCADCFCYGRAVCLYATSRSLLVINFLQQVPCCKPYSCNTTFVAKFVSHFPITKPLLQTLFLQQDPCCKIYKNIFGLPNHWMDLQMTVQCAHVLQPPLQQGWYFCNKSPIAENFRNTILVAEKTCEFFLQG